MNPASAKNVYSLPNAEFIIDNEPSIAMKATVIGSVFFILASASISHLPVGNHITLAKRYTFLIFIMLG